MRDSLGRVLVLGCIGVFTSAALVLPARAQEKCSFVEGTKSSNTKICEPNTEDLLTRTSNWLADRFVNGNKPNDKEVEALRRLISVADRWRSIDDAPAALANRITTSIDTLDSVITRIDRGKLDKAGSDAVDLKMRDLAHKVYAWLGGGLLGGTPHPDSFAQFASGLNTYLTNSNALTARQVAFRYGMPSEFTTLIGTVMDSGKAQPASTINVMAGHLSALLKNAEVVSNRSTFAKDGVLYSTLFSTRGAGVLDGLAAELEAIEVAAGRPAQMVIRRANALRIELAKATASDTDDKKKEAAVLLRALTTVDVGTALTNLKDQIEPIATPLEPRIHIVDAWYGHLGRSRGQCSATRTVRSECERKTECIAPEKSGLLDPAALCGFDPSPEARGLARGLVVHFTCEQGDSDFWLDLTKQPDVAPHTGVKYTTRNTQRVVLRSSKMKLSCKFPER